MTLQATLVSAADELHNARSVVADLRTVGDAVWDRFTASREESPWSDRALVDAFRVNPAHRPGAHRRARPDRHADGAPGEALMEQ